MSTLIVMAPPMAAAFFQGTLGQFASYSSFSGVGSQLGGQDQAAIAHGKQAAVTTPPPQPANTIVENRHDGQSSYDSLDSAACSGASSSRFVQDGSKFTSLTGTGKTPQ
ncbi:MULTISPECIES: hypothetical protein [Luteibacter]|uniref:hypothetical protein n=1 Tax=Luteibacter TaxID=242605 RepID=UPI0012E07334|nr:MULTISPECIES: hypothetical protein [unclassified Luteibacter]